MIKIVALSVAAVIAAAAAVVVVVDDDDGIIKIKMTMLRKGNLRIINDYHHYYSDDDNDNANVGGNVGIDEWSHDYLDPDANTRS